MLTSFAVGAVSAVVVWVATRRHSVVSDEAWMLVVADRVQRRGDTLYRDVFFGVGPLPLWLLLPFTRRAGIEVVALRRANAIVTGVFAGALWHLGDAVARQPWWACGVLVAATVAACGPVADLLSLYENLSRAGVGVAVVLVAQGHPVAITLAGLGMGVACASKYTVGAATAPAVLGLAWVCADDRRWLAAGAIAAVLVVAASIAPLARRPGALRAMAARLGPGKRSFVAHGRISLWRLVRHRRQHVLLLAVAVPLAVASAPLVLLALADGAPIHWVWTVAALLLAFWSCTWPRADSAHLRSGLPFALAAFLVAGSAPGPVAQGTPWWTLVRMALVPWAVAICATGVRYSLRRGAGARTAPLTRGCAGAWCRFTPDEVRSLWVASELSGGAAMILGDDAPLAYLVSGIHDPTPFDYPLASVFGPHGQADVAARIRGGSIPHVLEVEPMPTSMAPTEIDAAVREATTVVWQQGVVHLRRWSGQR